MLSLRKINPMARAVGTMGIVATMVGAVTFANLSSTAVALYPNDITVAGASLVIGAGTADVVAGTCTDPGTVTPGITDSSLAPGSSTNVTTFCLANTGDVPLSIAASIPQDLSGSAAAGATTLTVTCGDALVGPLSAWGPASFTTQLGAGQAETCTAQASLSGSFSGSGGDVIPTFQVNFVGTQV